MGTGTPENRSLDIVDRVRSWIPLRRDEPANFSRDFWMPDKSCRVCYECDSQFTVFNRKHHCRLCGRVFCANCTARFIPTSEEQKAAGDGHDESGRIRVCNFCFKQWEQGMVRESRRTSSSSDGVGSRSPSSSSMVSMNYSGTGNSGGGSAGSTAYSTGSYELVSSMSPQHSFVGSGARGNGPFDQISYNGSALDGSMTYSTGMYEHVSPRGSCMSPQQSLVVTGARGDEPPEPLHRNAMVNGDPSANQYHLGMNRSDDEDNYYAYQSDSEARQFSQPDEFYGTTASFYGMEHMYGAYSTHFDEEVNYGKSSHCPSPEILQAVEGTESTVEEPQNHDNGGDQQNSLCGSENPAMENLDYENDIKLWLPPEPEDEYGDREAPLSEDEYDDESIGEWGYPRSSSNLAEGDLRQRDKSNEDHRNAMRNVLGAHFRALIAQLLHVENIAICEEDHKDSWLDLITSLSWEAAALLKPDMSEGGGMDPGGYVKVKCLACGHRSDSMVVKGVVCKKNVAHRRMTSRINKPRVLILGGALEYQRVSHHLSSLDTLLQQEMDHLQMAVAKIGSHNPNILLVEKSVSRFAQEYLFERNISLVLNIKRPLLERIARCTGAQIVPSIDHLMSPKLGSCDSFHVDKYFEEHGTAGQGGKKLIKTLMFFDGCPKPLGCTILLKGAQGDELKKVKHVLHYGVFAAYHLALETSFLADEGASLPELPLKSPITVALPDKPTTIKKAISTLPAFNTTSSGKHERNQLREQQISASSPESDIALSNHHGPDLRTKQGRSSSSSEGAEFAQKLVQNFFHCNGHSSDSASASGSVTEADQFTQSNASFRNATDCASLLDDHAIPEVVNTMGASHKGVVSRHADGTTFAEDDRCAAGQTSSHTNCIYPKVGLHPSKEDLLPSGSSLADDLSILVSLTTRCVLKGVLCERARLLRIKYYGSFDKPLGRFLQDHLFNLNYHCCSCGMPSDAHIHCYTHQQGSLTISVRKLSPFLLPGEKEGKIWMWHRCLRCPRTNGLPPTTQKVLMSDAAWGLSFGKFLELSFSNHVAATRVASCGHSLHRDCLRFYGCGRMVACFRYAPIKVHSVCLPPPKLEFNYDKLEWIQQEATEVTDNAELLFTEVYNALNQVSEKLGNVGSLDGSVRAYRLRVLVSKLEKMLKKEKEEFEESLRMTFKWGSEVDQAAVDVLDLNRLRRQLLFYSYVWDKRLIYASDLNKSTIQAEWGDKTLKNTEKPAYLVGKIGVNSASKLDKCVKDLDVNVLGGNPPDVNQAGNISHVYQRSQHSREVSLDRLVDFECVEAGVHEFDPLSSEHTDHTAGMSPCLAKVSSTNGCAWTDDGHSDGLTPKENELVLPMGNAADQSDTYYSNYALKQSDVEVPQSPGFELRGEISDDTEISKTWPGMSFANFHASLRKNPLCNGHKLEKFGDYNPAYIMSFKDLLHQDGARLLLPLGVNDTFVPIYDDEPTSIVAYALASTDYHAQMLNSPATAKDGSESSTSEPLFDSTNSLSFHSVGKVPSDDIIFSLTGSWNSMVLDPLVYTKDLHTRVSFEDDGPLGKVKYTVTSYYAKRFEALRKICCPSELDFIRSLSRCKKWGAQGGKSNVFFAKSLDDRFIIKQVTKTELESFIKFAPSYFKYLTESISSGSPTCLAKILGMYQVTSKHLKGGKELKMDVLVMENLLFRRNITLLYDLKGSSRSRYNPDSSGRNNVLLDQNLIESMPTSPIFVGNKAKHLLERAIWNDTSFLASIYVMDYSLLVGVDEEKRELVLGIIDFMRQYTWDKHLETWVKASGILGGPKNVSPTVISPMQYKKRFRKAMSSYFLMVPEQWSPPTTVSPPDLRQDNT
ncbi:hypothetical protein Dimus_025850 [Dionaea muscipula]